jgi:hypothetical protein
MCSVQRNVTVPRGTSVLTFHRALSAMKQVHSSDGSDCYRTGAVLSGPGTGDDGVSYCVTCGAVWVVS